MYMYAIRSTTSRRLNRISQDLLRFRSISTMTTNQPAAISKQPPRTQVRDEEIKGVTKAMDYIDLTGDNLPKVLAGPPIRQSRSPNGAGGGGANTPGPKRTPRILNNKETRDQKVFPSAGSGGIPDPTQQYLLNSNIPSTPLTEPQHLLVVIDLNGTLLFRPNRRAPTKFTERPHTQRFLRYCIDTFTVVIWSSARPENVKNMCNAILSPDMRQKVAAIWGREKFGLTRADYDARVQCYKRLTKIWADPIIARHHPEYMQGGKWNQKNTVLLDDSLEKGRSEPFNLVEIPEFFGDGNEQGQILPQVHDFLNHLAMHSNVSSVLRASPFRPQLMSTNPDRIDIG